jgi:hypothetical protein
MKELANATPSWRESFYDSRSQVPPPSLTPLTSRSDLYSKERVFGLRLKIYQMSRLLEVYCPDLQQALQNDGLSLEIFTIGWIQTLFLCVEAMPAETIDRIWDIFITECSWVIIFQVAIAVVRLATISLHGKPLEAILEYFNLFPETEILEADLLLAEACRVNVTDEKLQHLQEIYFASVKSPQSTPR